MIAERNRSHLVVVDVQERLVPAVHQPEIVERNAGRLLVYAGLFDVPVTFTEHAPQGIGRTLPSLLEVAPSGAVVATKQTFSACREPSFAERLVNLRREQRDQIVVAGMEAHVCVCQTVLELRTQNYDVFLVADAVSSRTPENKELAIDRMARAGAHIVSHEMIAFEWLERGDTADFKRVLPLLK